MCRWFSCFDVIKLYSYSLLFYLLSTNCDVFFLLLSDGEEKWHTLTLTINWLLIHRHHQFSSTFFFVFFVCFYVETSI